MNKTLKMVGQLAIIACLCMAFEAAAAGDGGLFTIASEKLGQVFQNVRKIVFILGGFALVGFAIAAIFGKLQWKSVAVLAVGLALLAVASKVVEFAVNSNADVGDAGDYGSALEDFQ